MFNLVVWYLRGLTPSRTFFFLTKMISYPCWNTFRGLREYCWLVWEDSTHEKFFRSLIKSTWNQIVFIWFWSKRTSVLIQIISEMVNTIWFRFRFNKISKSFLCMYEISCTVVAAISHVSSEPNWLHSSPRLGAICETRIYRFFVTTFILSKKWKFLTANLNIPCPRSIILVLCIM